ncbi:hypothetical protein LCGC14_0374880 [marine sediment metagenome]|uniref:Uncharacterized protein n=1 Tax=marine sediment metagenome TaxID=412755 RepID=A0A0F9WD05_9ZZZZ
MKKTISILLMILVLGVTSVSAGWYYDLSEYDGTFNEETDTEQRDWEDVMKINWNGINQEETVGKAKPENIYSRIHDITIWADRRSKQGTYIIFNERARWNYLTFLVDHNQENITKAIIRMEVYNKNKDHLIMYTETERILPYAVIDYGMYWMYYFQVKELEHFVLN